MRSALVRLSHQSSALATIQLRCQSQVTGTSWLAGDKQDWSTAPTVQSLAKLQKKKLQEHQQKAESAPRVAFDDSHKTNTKAEGISRAMNYYMQKLSERDTIIRTKAEEYEIGKRHLARMMGEDPEAFTQKNVDKAIEYLLPSGLFEKKARPFLKHPLDYYPKSKTAAFDIFGRPLHTLFYTGIPEYYQVIYDMTQKLLALNKLEDATNAFKRRLKQNEEEISQKVDLTGSQWISHKALCLKIGTNIDEFSYTKFIRLLQKLADHPLSSREEEFISRYKVVFVPPIKLSEIPALLVDEQGKSYQEIKTTQRTAIVTVKLYEGDGKLQIKAPEGNFNISFFEALTHREQLLMPFKVVNRINKFDIVATVNNGGMSCLAKALRSAISRCLCSFVSADEIEKLRLAGLLTLDHRPKERKKFGQEGARRKYTWKKR